MEKINLEKFLLTEEDFEKMGWHDSHIYAVAFRGNYEFALDIDYIIKWVQPSKDDYCIKFWISPCTLIFENVYHLKFNIEVTEPFELKIENIMRKQPSTTNKRRL